MTINGIVFDLVCFSFCRRNLKVQSASNEMLVIVSKCGASL
jgi:hypothetical protein